MFLPNFLVTVTGLFPRFSQTCTPLADNDASSYCVLYGFSRLSSFSDPLLRWYQNLVFRFRYLTLSECLTDIRWTLVDYLRAAWYWAVELTRTRPLQRQEIKQRDLPELVFGSDATTERRDDMPETTPVVVAPPRRKHRRRKPGVLEPAFENNGDYPEGWMVYHALLGVVSKEVADKFEQGKRAETQKNGAVSDNAGDVADDTSSSEKENGVVHALQRELSNESDGSGDVVEFEEENEAGHRLDAGEDRKPEASEVINGGPAFSEPPQNGTTSFTNSSSNHLCATIS